MVSFASGNSWLINGLPRERLSVTTDWLDNGEIARLFQSQKSPSLGDGKVKCLFYAPVLSESERKELVDLRNQIQQNEAIIALILICTSESNMSLNSITDGHWFALVASNGQYFVADSLAISRLSDPRVSQLVRYLEGETVSLDMPDNQIPAGVTRGKLSETVFASLGPDSINITRENTHTRNSQALLREVPKATFVSASLQAVAGTNASFSICVNDDWITGAPQHRIVLFDAVIHDKIELVKELLNASCNADESNIYGETSLFIAAKKGYGGLVKLLLAKKVNTERANIYEETSLFVAAKLCHVEVVNLLIAAKADTNKTNIYGETALFAAVCANHVEIVRLLLAAGSNHEICNHKNVTPLRRALLSNCDSEIVQMLLNADKGLRPPTGSTMLFFDALAEGRFVVVELLIKAGIDANKVHLNKMTALHVAAQNGHERVVQLLLAKDVGKDCISNFVTPLYLAAEHGQAYIVELLLQSKADFEKTESDLSPLSIAAKKGHLQVVKLLLAAGANREVSTRDGSTPLFIAAQNGHNDIVNYLLAMGVKKDMCNLAHETPLYVAAKKGHKLVVESLLKREVDLEKAARDGSTPLYIAAANGHLGVVKLLIDANANPNCMSNGLKPHMIADRNGHHHVYRFLLDNGSR